MEKQTSSLKPMTASQSWAIFCALRWDVRKATTTYSEASRVLLLAKRGFKNEAIEIVKVWPGAVQKEVKVTKTKQDWTELYQRAFAAGCAAADACVPTPMVVESHVNPLDDASPVTERYFIPSGVCGFAWVTIHPANCSFARWLKERDLAETAYGGGMQMGISQYNQCMAKKEAFAHAFAKVCQAADLRAYAGSRMD